MLNEIGDGITGPSMLVDWADIARSLLSVNRNNSIIIVDRAGVCAKRWELWRRRDNNNLTIGINGPEKAAEGAPNLV